MQEFAAQLEGLWAQALEIWAGGGWAMYAIAGIALVMFATGMGLHFKLLETGYRDAREKVWRHWLKHPEERSGPVGELLDQVDGAATVKEIADRFTHLRDNETRPFERDLRVMRVCVSSAPLVGLLGTVTGMLSTFSALASGSGGDQTMGMVASGISEALITTETGLVIALPGLFLQYHLQRRYEGYRAFLAHLETVCTQRVHRSMRKQRKRQLKRAAQERVAMLLFRRLRPDLPGLS